MHIYQSQNVMNAKPSLRIFIVDDQLSMSSNNYS